MSARVTVTPMEATVKTGVLGGCCHMRPHSNARIQSLCVDKVRFHQAHVNSPIDCTLGYYPIRKMVQRNADVMSGHFEVYSDTAAI